MEAEFTLFSELLPEFALLLGRIWGGNEARWRRASIRGLATLVVLRTGFAQYLRASKHFPENRGLGALKELDAEYGEVKSMHTAAGHLRKGVGSFVLEHIISEAKRRGYRRLSLETGSMSYFRPAHALYQKFGFKRCAPFADYREDPNIVFMTREL